MFFNKRSYVSGHFYIELDGHLGSIENFEGGNARAEIVHEPVANSLFLTKHLGSIKYEDFNLTVGSNMDTIFYRWLNDMMIGKSVRKNGAIIETDNKNIEISRMTFTNALINEVVFPALDAASKDTASITVRITPEMTRYNYESKGALIKKNNLSKSLKVWTASNFRLKIDGLDSATLKVNRISPIIIKQKISRDNISVERMYQNEPGKIEFSDLVVTVANSNAKPFFDWFEDFAIKGNNGNDKEKSGTIEYLSANMQETLFKLELSNIGIYRFVPARNDAEAIRRDIVSMYIEKVKLS